MIALVAQFKVFKSICRQIVCLYLRRQNKYVQIVYKLALTFVFQKNQMSETLESIQKSANATNQRLPVPEFNFDTPNSKTKRTPKR